MGRRRGLGLLKLQSTKSMHSIGESRTEKETTSSLSILTAAACLICIGRLVRFGLMQERQGFKCL